MTTPEGRGFARRLLASAAILFLVWGGVPASLACSPRPQSKKSEQPYALIYGTVYGPNDLAVYGVRVHIRRSDQKKPKWELFSDHAGEFAQRVPAGQATYVIWADLKGYKPLNGKKLEAGEPVTVQIQNDERADISLHLK
ncbi:MAG TPA: hypothetical protein VF011_03940 [Terriglobales bacterium]